MSNIPSLVKIIRPQQWYKNVLVFVPLVFSLNLFQPDLIILSFLGFVALCLASGGSYVINDVFDYKKDLLHPKKRNRPIPSGRLSVKSASIYGIVLLIVGSILAFSLNEIFFIVVILLILSTFFYSKAAKDIFLLDVFLIAINFVLRAIAGVFLIGVDLSPWLVIGIFFVALLLGFTKRQNELNLLKEQAVKHKKVLEHYTEKFLRYAIGQSSAASILAYSIYSINGPGIIGDWRLVLTIPIVFFILVSYVNNIINVKYPSKELEAQMISDKKISVSLLVYVVMVIILIYFVPSSFFTEI